MASDFESDIVAIESITAVPTILDVVCRTTGMGFAAIARVTEDRWIACAVRDDIEFGLRPGGELKVETTICHEIRASGGAVIINHVAEDDAYFGHPTAAQYGFQSYISMPILLSDGRFFGTLCAIDPRPAKLKTPEVIGMFKLFAELIGFHLEAHERLAESASKLKEERETAELREQFIAVLGHDLRNPLAAISSGTRLLLDRPLDDRAAGVVGMMQASVSRMAGLIDDVLDFARGRLGGGVALKLAAEPLAPILEQVVTELRVTMPDKPIDVRFALQEPVSCDPNRIAQLFSNLLGNALAYGSAQTPVRVEALSANGVFELSVANSGPQIPPETLTRLMQPFFRGAAQATGRGLGLGLYIASEVARAHGGTIDVVSTPEETVFTFRMPIARAI
ncbi:MAG: histidine kinase [Rubritepida sp.]|nr:histidine kinase [Rubritepida sp.]